MGAHVVLRSRHRRRRVRFARRLSHRPAGSSPCAHVQHFVVCDLGVRGGLRDVTDAIARVSLPGVHRCLRRVRRRRRVARRIIPRPQSTRAGARLHPGILVLRRPARRRDERPRRQTRDGFAGDSRRPRSVALHPHLRSHPGDSAHAHPTVPAGITRVGAQTPGRSAQTAEPARLVQPRVVENHRAHHAHLRRELRHRVWAPSNSSRKFSARSASARPPRPVTPR